MQAGIAGSKRLEYPGKQREHVQEKPVEGLSINICSMIYI
jgi:hypothetical protein